MKYLLPNVFGLLVNRARVNTFWILLKGPLGILLKGPLDFEFSMRALWVGVNFEEINGF